MSTHDADSLDIRPSERTDTPAITALLHELGYPANTEKEAPLTYAWVVAVVAVVA